MCKKCDFNGKDKTEEPCVRCDKITDLNEIINLQDKLISQLTDILLKEEGRK